jgi:cytochrome c biogenesis protein CcdA
MLQLIGVMLTVGLADSLNPSTIGPGLYLATAEHGLRQVLVFTAGVFLAYLAGGCLLVFGPGHAILSLVPSPGATVRYWLELAAGLTLIAGALVTWWRRAALARRDLPAPRKGGRSGFVLGASLMAVELPTAFPYFGAVAAIVGSTLNDAQQFLLLGIFNLVFVLPLLAIALALVVRGRRANAVLVRARELLERHWPQMLACLLGALGAVVVLLGVTGLISQGSSPLARSVGHFRRALTHP